MMDIRQVNAVKKELNGFVLGFKPVLGRSERTHWCQAYLTGLIMEGERKSIQAMASRLPNGNEQAMQQFVDQSPWSHESLQLELSQYILNKLKPKKGVLVIDDTGLPKKGKHSVGVSRQYCGALGKVANCQSLVTWHFAGKEHFPLLGELYLPKNWCEDKVALKKKGVPEARHTFLKKWELALRLLDSLTFVPHEAIVFDAGFGEIRGFLDALDKRGEIFVGQVPESHCFWPKEVPLKEGQNTTGRPRRFSEVKNRDLKPLSAKQWGEQLLKEGNWRRVRLSLASKPYTYVTAIRVREVIPQAYYRPGAPRWLIFEKYGNGQLKYYISNAPEHTSLKKLVNWAHERWKIEQGYQQLKKELGLDHFEGRSWRGLHHHLTLCFMAYAFLLLLRKHFNKKKSDAQFTCYAKAA